MTDKIRKRLGPVSVVATIAVLGSLGRVHRAGRAAGYHFRAGPAATATASEW